MKMQAKNAKADLTLNAEDAMMYRLDSLHLIPNTIYWLLNLELQ